MTTKPKTAARPKGLGMGLAQLLGGNDAVPSLNMTAAAPEIAPSNTLLLSAMQAGRYQPRTRMDETALQELASSIKQHGLMQPIMVRKLGATSPTGATYEIIAGERRFRASKIAGLLEVPVIVRDVDDENTLALALIENIQREDLNPLEEAQAIKRLIEEFSYSHEKASEAIGRSRSATSNLLRLLNLADPVQSYLLAGDLDMGHARALLALEKAEQIMLGTEVVEKRLSVRETEKLVNQHLTQRTKIDTGEAKPSVKATKDDMDVARLAEQLSDALGAVVVLKPKAKQSGELTIKFATHEQLKGLLERMGVGDLIN
jgi:ParB family transcriptional regulator, chromosome partitioning protein